MIRNKKLIYLGYVIPVIFWSTTIICGLMTEDYNHFSNLVSELGAIGTKTQYVFTIGLALSSILSVLFIIGLYKTAKEIGIRTIPILIILTFSFSILGAAIFPMPLKLHGILGSPSILLTLSPLLALILWHGEIIPNVKIASGIILLIMLLGFLILTPSILENNFGLKQRFFHIAWTLWFIYLSQKFIKLKQIQIANNLSY